MDVKVVIPGEGTESLLMNREDKVLMQGQDRSRSTGRGCKDSGGSVRGQAWEQVLETRAEASRV